MALSNSSSNNYRSTSSTSQVPIDMQVKLLMIGDSGVGKTCLLLRYTNDSFSPTFITTIGIDFKVKTVQISPPSVGNEQKKSGKPLNVKLQIWDTAGQERFRTITTSYFRGAQGVMIVYDVTDRKSFENVRVWLNQVNQHADYGVSKILVANKVDITEDNSRGSGGVQNSNFSVVLRTEGEQLAKECGLEFLETSAKDNVNVTKAFTQLTENVVRRLQAENKVTFGSGAAKKTDQQGNKAGTPSSQKVDLGTSLDSDKSKYPCCST